MSTKVTINRLATGVPGLDEVLGGGLPEFSFNLIAGPPGCGKTTLAHQMMFALATPERPALFFTVLGEPPLKMLRYQQQFDFFDSDAINQSIRYVNLADDTLAGDLDEVLRRIVGEVEAHSPALVFVDSFRSVVLASQTQDNPNNNLPQFVQQLGMLMTTWQATPDRRILYRNRYQPDFHRGRWADLAAPERPAQLHGAQDGNHEDARPADAAGSAHLPYRFVGDQGIFPRTLQPGRIATGISHQAPGHGRTAAR